MGSSNVAQAGESRWPAPGRGDGIEPTAMPHRTVGRSRGITEARIGPAPERGRQSHETRVSAAPVRGLGRVSRRDPTASPPAVAAGGITVGFIPPPPVGGSPPSTAGPSLGDDPASPLLHTPPRALHQVSAGRARLSPSRRPPRADGRLGVVCCHRSRLSGPGPSEVEGSFALPPRIERGSPGIRP